jgi:hypothetical protein
VAGVLICTEVFQPLALAEATALGLPDMRMAVVPHPVGSFSTHELLRRGVPQAALTQILKILGFADSAGGRDD